MYSIGEYIDAALETAYRRTAGKLLDQITAITTSKNAPMQRALTQLDSEAQRQDDEGEKMLADNAALRNSLAEYGTSFNAAGTLIQANDDAIEQSARPIAIAAVAAGVLRGVADELVKRGKNPLAITEYKAAAQALGFTIPDAMNFLQSYVTSDAWIAKMEKWGAGYAELTRETIENGLASGWSPIRTAREMRRYAENLPRSAAESLTRTLQLTSYRDANAAMEAINGEFIERKIRTATLDDRTCAACIALHGTELKAGERVDDHYRGRCDVFYIVPGGARQPEFMQSDSTPGNRNFVPYQTGEEWFASLSPERQAAQATFQRTPAKLRAYRAGVPLSAFVGEHDDPVFGKQIVERSLLASIGGDAPQYYEREQKND